MHVFLDDSGDPGMKFSKGSSRFLVMAACVFRDDAHIEQAVNALEACRRSMNRSAAWEFKYSKTSRDMQAKFFECTRTLKYDVRAIVIDKQRLYSDPLINRPGYLQNYAIMQLLSHTLDTVKDAKLVIDGQDRRAFNLKSSNSSYFLKEVNAHAPGTLAKVEYDDSVRNPLIQLADMTAGAIRRHFEEPAKANNLHFAMIKGRTRAPRGSLWDFTAEK